MGKNRDKLLPLNEAVDKYVHSGSHLSIGGFTINRNPMAAVYEIIRQKKKNIHLYVHSNGQGMDELVGGGCVSRLELAYGGSGRFAPTCIRFKKAVAAGELLVEDYSNYHMTLRFLAGSMGLPYLPTKSGLETDLVEKWGFSREMREKDEGLPDDKLIVQENPFKNWGNAEKLVLVPAINPDVTVIHVQKADKFGNCRINGLPYNDLEQAKSAKVCIITCEDLVETDELRQNADLNALPAFMVDAVCHAPWGAYPTACYGYYDYDPQYLNNYKDTAARDDQYADYLNKYVLGPADHGELLDLIGTDRLESIKADPGEGYKLGLDRT